MNKAVFETLQDATDAMETANANAKPSEKTGKLPSASKVFKVVQGSKTYYVVARSINAAIALSAAEFGIVCDCAVGGKSRALSADKVKAGLALLDENEADKVAEWYEQRRSARTAA